MPPTSGKLHHEYEDRKTRKRKSCWRLVLCCLRLWRQMCMFSEQGRKSAVYLKNIKNSTWVERSPLPFHSGGSLGADFHLAPMLVARRREVKRVCRAAALLHHYGRMTFALQLLPPEEREQVWVGVGGTKMNRWTDGGWVKVWSTNRSSPWGVTWRVWGCTEVFSHKKRGPTYFILSLSSRTSVTYQRNSSPIHLLSLGLDRVVP